MIGDTTMNKTKKIVFITHYFNKHITLRVPRDKNFEGCSYMKAYHEDDDRIMYGQEPKYFTRWQIEKINSACLAYGKEFVCEAIEA